MVLEKWPKIGDFCEYVQKSLTKQAIGRLGYFSKSPRCQNAIPSGAIQKKAFILDPGVTFFLFQQKYDFGREI